LANYTGSHHKVSHLQSILKKIRVEITHTKTNKLYYYYNLPNQSGLNASSPAYTYLSGSSFKIKMAVDHSKLTYSGTGYKLMLALISSINVGGK
jgi:hypothetical protein